MTNILKILLLFFIPLFFLGCDPSEKVPQLEKTISEQDAKIKILESDLSQLRENFSNHLNYVNTTLIPQLNNRFINLPDYSYRIYGIERQLAAEKTISFDFAEKGYGKLETSSGFLLISIDDVKPFADGVKVVIKIGNPLLSHFKGFKMHVKYGPREPEFPKDFNATGSYDIYLEKCNQWKTDIQERDLDFTEDLFPGAWNKAVMILPKIKSSDLGYLEITMFTNTLYLADRAK